MRERMGALRTARSLRAVAEYGDLRRSNGALLNGRVAKEMPAHDNLDEEHSCRACFRMGNLGDPFPDAQSKRWEKA
ncbi:MAG: hypothetical protein V1800_09570 [Candidatus Latescibacterota bacterium]